MTVARLEAQMAPISTTWKGPEVHECARGDALHGPGPQRIGCGGYRSGGTSRERTLAADSHRANGRPFVGRQYPKVLLFDKEVIDPVSVERSAHSWHTIGRKPRVGVQPVASELAPR